MHMFSLGGIQTADSEGWKAQSSTIAVLLMVAVALIIAAAAGAFFLDFGGEQEDAVVSDIDSDIENGTLTIRHTGGDTLQSEDIEVIIANDTSQTTVDLETTLSEEQFEAGGRLETTTGLTGEVRVQVVHEPTNAVLSNQLYEVGDGSGGGSGPGGGPGGPGGPQPFSMNGTVSVNPPIEDAVVTAYDDATKLAETMTDASGRYSFDVDDSVTHLTVSVEGASVGPYSNLYAGSKRDVSGSAELNFTFSATPDVTTTVDGTSVDVVYGAQEGDASARPIANVEMLQAVNASLGADYELVGDIDASGTSAWNGGKGFEPIGSAPSARFTGTFDGNSHAIDGLFIDRPTDFVGLFATNRGRIENVGLENIDISGSGLVGGLVGSNGGFSGDGTVHNSYATGTISGGTSVGGLIGKTIQGDVSESYAAVDVSSSSSGFKHGGLVGKINQAEITESYATGDVNGGDKVGGFAGSTFRATVSDSYATGDTSGTEAIGGLIGLLGSNSDVSTSYATGTLSGSSDIGGLIGVQISSSTTNSYWDTQTTGQASSAGGTGLTTSEMRGASATSKMSGFDFANTWDVVNTNTGSGTTVSYPYLTANQQDPKPGRETVTNPYAGGDGSASNPYQIENWNHLDNVRDNLDANFTLVSDIDQNTAGYADVASGSANGGKGFEPIGEYGTTGQTVFNGTFDGNGHTIAGLVIDRSGEDEVGLFGRARGQPAAAGPSQREIVDVVLENVDITGDIHVGGLLGYAQGGAVRESAVSGTVSATERAGGVVGWNNAGTIEESYATVDVSTSGGDAGGLVGTTLVGTISDSYATGNVSGDDSVGGLVGSESLGGGEVTTSYAVGNVTGTSNVGGLIGYESSLTVTDSYWDTQTTGQSSSAGGTGLTTSEMQGSSATSKMSGFDFANTWTTVTSPDDYPELQGVG